MNRPDYRVDIDRLVLDGLELTPAQVEHLRVQTAAEMQRLISQRGWSNEVVATKVAELSLPLLSPEASPDHGRMAKALAQHLVQALPGGRQTK